MGETEKKTARERVSECVYVRERVRERERKRKRERDFVHPNVPENLKPIYM